MVRSVKNNSKLPRVSGHRSAEEFLQPRNAPPPAQEPQAGPRAGAVRRPDGVALTADHADQARILRKRWLVLRKRWLAARKRCGPASPRATRRGAPIRQRNARRSGNRRTRLTGSDNPGSGGHGLERQGHRQGGGIARGGRRHGSGTLGYRTLGYRTLPTLGYPTLGYRADARYRGRLGGANLVHDAPDGAGAPAAGGAAAQAPVDLAGSANQAFGRDGSDLGVRNDIARTHDHAAHSLSSSAPRHTRPLPRLRGPFFPVSGTLSPLLPRWVGHPALLRVRVNKVPFSGAAQQMKTL